MKRKRIAVLIIMPLIIALTVLIFLLAHNSQYWSETNSHLGKTIAEWFSFLVVLFEADIFISLIYFTSKKEKRKEIKTTANKVALYAALFSIAVNIIGIFVELSKIPFDIPDLIFTVLLIFAFIADLAVIIARLTSFRIFIIQLKEKRQKELCPKQVIEK